MTLYLGSDKVKINFNGVIYRINPYIMHPVVNGISLLSLDNYILKDINGLYLTAKEDK